MDAGGHHHMQAGPPGGADITVLAEPMAPAYDEAFHAAGPAMVDPMAEEKFQPQQPQQRGGDQRKSTKNLTALGKKGLLEEFKKRREIPFWISAHFERLRNREIVFIVDDSGSMGCSIDDFSIPREDAKRIMQATGLQVIRRWDELKYYLEYVLELAVCFDEDGLDLIGLNRPAKKSVNNLQGLTDFFQKEPEGTTPLYTVLEAVLKEHVPGTKKVIIIATDGVPNDRSLADFRNLVRRRAGKSAAETPIVFMICTDNDSDVDYLDGLDRAPWVGVVDDYRTEKEQIKDRDRRRQYSPGAHVCNILMNWVPELDRMDESKCCVLL